MASFYKIDFMRPIPHIDKYSGMNEDEAYLYVCNGGDVWTQYGSDARDLAGRFSGYYHDYIHFDLRNSPGEKYTLEHFHNFRGAGHSHIFFGYAVNDQDPNHQIDIWSIS